MGDAMDHADAREALELAAVEPDGLDRLVAGDTPAAAALASHLAGCDECSALLARLRRDAPMIASVLRTTAPPQLRDRTLAYVSQLGVPRGAAAPETQPDARIRPFPAVPRTDPTATGPVAARSPSARSALPRLAAIAAALVVAVAGVGFLLNAERDAAIALRDAELSRQAGAVAALNRVTARAIRIAAEPDARLVPLRAGDASAAGSIVFSASTGELAVVVDGLAEPAEGKELRCWLEADGERRPVGRMFFGGATAFWAGPVDGGLAGVEGFGITLVDADGASVDGDPVLSGDLAEG
jgi:hypothetical protein